MARIIGKIIKGSVGDVVHKVYRGMQIMQAKPKFTTGSQTLKTKKAAATFGAASGLALAVRDCIRAVIQDMYDGTMIARLNKEVLYSLRESQDMDTGIFNFNNNSFSRLNGFEFNDKSPLRNQLLFQPSQSLQGTSLTVDFPEMIIPKQLKFMPKAEKCVLTVAIGMYDLTFGRTHLLPVQIQEIKLAKATLPPKQFKFEIEPGCLCITVFSLQYIRATFAGNILLNTKAFSPSAIFKAIIAEGDVNEKKPKKWKKIKFRIESQDIMAKYEDLPTE